MKNRARLLLHIFLALGLIIGLAACSDSSDQVPPPAPAPEPDSLGLFGVGHSAFTAIDPLRGNRMLPVEVWYPVDPEDRQDSPRTSYPLAAGIGLESAVAVEDLPVSKREEQKLLVFSHGYGGINTASTVLVETLASHGFIVIAPEHTGNSQASNDDIFDQAAAGGGATKTLSHSDFADIMADAKKRGSFKEALNEDLEHGNLKEEYLAHATNAAGRTTTLKKRSRPWCRRACAAAPSRATRPRDAPAPTALR